MKSLVMLAAVVAALIAAPAVADDGQVSREALRAVGLGSMQLVSDREGLQVRGRQSAFVSVRFRFALFQNENILPPEIQPPSASIASRVTAPSPVPASR